MGKKQKMWSAGTHLIPLVGLACAGWAFVASTEEFRLQFLTALGVLLVTRVIFRWWNDGAGAGIALRSKKESDSSLDPLVRFWQHTFGAHLEDINQPGSRHKPVHISFDHNYGNNKLQSLISDAEHLVGHHRGANVDPLRFIEAIAYTRPSHYPKETPEEFATKLREVSEKLSRVADEVEPDNKGK